MSSSPNRPPPLTRTLRLGVALLTAGLLTVAGGWPSAASAARFRPPPLPSCFATGSGYGSCQGEVIPAGGTVTKLIASIRSKGEFKLSGPAPLQSTMPVACGEAGCLYNHLDWYVGNGATVVSGCQTNESRCVVRVAKQLPLWSVVYVRQNNDAPQLFALWVPPSSATLSGRVMSSKCSATSCTRRPEGGVPVVAEPSGGGRTARARTGSDGRYKMRVVPDVYSVSAAGGKSLPKSQRADLDGRNVSGVDFVVCAGSGRATAALVGFHCEVNVSVSAHDESGDALHHVMFLASNSTGDLANLLELPSSAEVRSPGRFTLTDQEWTVQAVRTLSDIQPDGTRVRLGDDVYSDLSSECAGETPNLPLPGNHRSTCRWDLSGKGQRPGAFYSMDAVMAVSPVDVSLARGLHTGAVTVFAQPENLLRWSGAGAPQSSLRFEVPQTSSGRVVVSAEGAKVTACSPGAVEQDGTYCVLDMDHVYGRRGAKARVSLAPAG